MRVFITGASAGLGRALALQYAAQGAVLGLTARRVEALRAVASSAGTTVSVYPVDVRDESAMREVAADFICAHGVPQIVIANAGVSIGTDLARAEDLEVFAEVLDTNVGGLLNTFQPFVKPMIAAGSGVLAGIASVAGYRGLPGAAAYCSSKAAAISCLESLRVELAGSGIRVITICPGYIETDMTAHNPYRMPFMMSADAAAAKIRSVIEGSRRYVVIPWQMAFVAKLLRVLPNAVFDRFFARAPRKPRRTG
jgi:short-subunit dehydrogenase